MKNVKLNETEIRKLIRQKSLFLEKDNFLQIVDGDLVLNENGDIYYSLDMDIQFQKRDIENKFIIDDIKEIVCQHLNLHPAEVIFSQRYEGTFDFYVRFDAQNQWKIVVCDFPTAVSNTNQLCDEKPIVEYGDEIIGFYRRLGDSAYYFRWFNDD